MRARRGEFGREQRKMRAGVDDDIDRVDARLIEQARQRPAHTAAGLIAAPWRLASEGSTSAADSWRHTVQSEANRDARSPAQGRRTGARETRPPQLRSHHANLTSM